VRLTVPEYIIKAFNGEIALEKKTIENIKNKIGELSIDNALNDQKLRDNLIKIALKDHSVIRKLNTAARNSEVNLMRYVIHHEGNHIASALITLHRNTCVLNSWAEIWIDFCTRLERAHIEGAVLRLPVSGHIKFAEYIIDRAETNGKSLEEILEAIWRYCFDLDISPERAREILGENLNIETEHIKKLEKMKKVAKAVDYCNNKIPNFNFSLSLTKKTNKKKKKP